MMDERGRQIKWDIKILTSMMESFITACLKEKGYLCKNCYHNRESQINCLGVSIQIWCLFIYKCITYIVVEAII